MHQKIKEKRYNIFFSTTLLKNCIDKLELNKFHGFDLISNEFSKLGNSNVLESILKKLFDSILSTGYVPENFNNKYFNNKANS